MSDHERPWVGPEDIKGIGYGLFIDEDEFPQIAELIKFAEQKILSRKALRIEKRLNEGTLDLDVVRGVVMDMVLRVIKNPSGLQSDGTGSVTTAYFRGAASGAIELLDEDLEALTPRSRTVGTMRVRVPGWRLP